MSKCDCQCKEKKHKCCKPKHHVYRCPTECKTYCGCEPKLTVTIHKAPKKVRVHREHCKH